MMHDNGYYSSAACFSLVINYQGIHFSKAKNDHAAVPLIVHSVALHENCAQTKGPVQQVIKPYYSMLTYNIISAEIQF